MAEIGFDNKASVIVLRVEIRAGDKVVRPKMALDTGATYTMISREIAEKLRLKHDLSKRRADIITAGGVENVPIVVVPSIKVAGTEAQNTKAIIHDLPEESYVDGLLGLSFLRNFNILLDFKKGILTIE